MTILQTRTEFDSTSAAGAMFARQVRGPIVVGLLLFGLGTSAATELPRDQVFNTQRSIDRTNTGAATSEAAPSGAGIGELRRLSGLTWDQLARLFNVSRRSLHLWASGKPMAASNEEHLQRLLAVMRKIDRGTAAANRSALIGALEDGSLPFDLLANGEYERVLSLVRLGEGRPTSPQKIADEVRAKRAPRPPDELVGAFQDRIHRDAGGGRAARSVRVRSSREG